MITLITIRFGNKGCFLAQKIAYFSLIAQLWRYDVWEIKLSIDGMTQMSLILPSCSSPYSRLCHGPRWQLELSIPYAQRKGPRRAHAIP